ncbi:uncharacterized protein LOC144420007 [Styela clava]
MSYQKVIAKVNDNTEKCTDLYDFAEPHGVFKRKLNVDVTPQLEEIDFYRGGRIPEHDYVPESPNQQNNLTKEERVQAIDIAKTHPEEVLFMLDSLDTLQYTVDGVYELISLDEPAYPETQVSSVYIYSYIFTEIQDIEEKRDIFKKSLQLQLKEISHKSDLLELFTALNEAKNGMSDIVKSSLNKIDMSVYPLSISDVHVIGSVAFYCTSLSMDFSGCDLKSASLQTLASELKESNVKIMKFNLYGNANMGVEGLSSVGQILSNQSCVEEFSLIDCNLSSDQLQALKLSLGSTEIMKFELHRNTNIGVEGLSSVGKILSNQSCVEEFSLIDCNLSSDQLQALKLSLGSTEIMKFYLHGNKNMGVEGLSSVESTSVLGVAA